MSCHWNFTFLQKTKRWHKVGPRRGWGRSVRWFLWASGRLWTRQTKEGEAGGIKQSTNWRSLGRLQERHKDHTSKKDFLYRQSQGTVTTRVQQNYKSQLGLRATCTSVSLACSYFELAQSSVNSGTCHDELQSGLPIGQATAQVCLPKGKIK